MGIFKRRVNIKLDKSKIDDAIANVGSYGWARASELGFEKPTGSGVSINVSIDGKTQADLKLHDWAGVDENQIEALASQVKDILRLSLWRR